MEEQNSVKGQTFTLMIFGGIVVLCSIFFILGMLVGRTQGLKQAAVAAAEAAAKSVPKEQAGEVRPELSFYDSVDKKKPAVLESAPPRSESKPSATPAAPRAKVEPPPVPANGVTLQVDALGSSSAAARRVEELKKKGFRAFILSPAPGDNKRLYRVQVPVPDRNEVDMVKRALEALGYRPILKQ